MSTSKGKGKVVDDDTVSVVGSVKEEKVQVKSYVPAVKKPDLFYENRKKWNAYRVQVKLFWWADLKREPTTRYMKIRSEQVCCAASFLKRPAFEVFESYLTAYLTTS